MPAGPSPRKGWIYFRRLGLKTAALADHVPYFKGSAKPAPAMAVLLKKFLLLSFIGSSDFLFLIDGLLLNLS